MLDRYVHKLKTREPFTLARYGDGEWRCILGDAGRNCDGHEYFPALRDDLRQTIHQPAAYEYGLVRIARTKEGQRIDAYLARHRINIPWVDGTTFADASRAGKLYPLVNILRRRRVLYVGPAFLRWLPFPVARYVEAPTVNAYLALDWLRDEVLKQAHGMDVIGFSTGPATKVLIYELYPILGRTHTLVDFGSLWDGFAGVLSRTYMKTPKWLAARAANLGHEDQKVAA